MKEYEKKEKAQRDNMPFHNFIFDRLCNQFSYSAIGGLIVV